MGVHTFSNSICSEENVEARLEFELAYYDSAVCRFNHYTTRIHTQFLKKKRRKKKDEYKIKEPD